MKRSFVRLTISSVLLCWAAGMAIIYVYATNVTWTEAKARETGVMLVYGMLDPLPAAKRAQRLAELQPNFQVNFALLSLAEIEHRTGRVPRPGEHISLKVSAREAWYMMAFKDGDGGLAAGPTHPAIPTDVVPVGMIYAIVGLPVIAGLVALRVDRELNKVERASQALADGELSVRVDNQHGPSNELAATFNSMAERVERLIRSRDELVQAVSHELGSPLSRLRFHLELLENQSDDSQREERVNAMTRELDALDDLVAELLSYVQSDELELDRQVFEPSQVLSDLAELAGLEAPEHRLVEVDVKLIDNITVFADQRLFQRAIENVLRNAVRYAESKVLLELTQDDHQVWVAVHDDGPGIPEELREKVMAPFVRLDADRDRKTGGVGLGLAIVSRIMNRHDGRIAITSSPLGGATVATLWPRPPSSI